MYAPVAHRLDSVRYPFLASWDIQHANIAQGNKDEATLRAVGSGILELDDLHVWNSCYVDDCCRIDEMAINSRFHRFLSD